MATQLRFPIFIGTFTESAEEVLVKLQKALPADLKKFLADYDSGIEEDIQGDSRYSLGLMQRLVTVLV
ncbi:MAG: hypothetical protein WDM88_03425 [Galbitalea sp.]